MLSILTGGLDYAREHYDHKSPNPLPSTYKQFALRTHLHTTNTHTQTQCGIYSVYTDTQNCQTQRELA